MLNSNNMYRSSKWTQDQANAKGDEKKTSISAKKNDLSHLKPVFEFGEDVCAAWWSKDSIVKDGSNAQWFHGKVSSYREKDKGSPYGPLRFYDILFNDGDVSECYGKSGLEEHWVMSSEDYIIYMEEIEEIKKIKKETIDLLKNIDEFEIDIINKNKLYKEKILLYKLFLENLIIEHHNFCNKLFTD